MNESTPRPPVLTLPEKPLFQTQNQQENPLPQTHSHLQRQTSQRSYNQTFEWGQTVWEKITQTVSSFLALLVSSFLALFAYAVTFSFAFVFVFASIIIMSSAERLYAITPAETVEIRLHSPHHVYAIEPYVYVDALGSASIISPEVLINLRYNIPITLTYYLELHEKRFFFFSRKHSDLQIVSRITHDLWSDTYIVQSSASTERYANIEDLGNVILQLKKVAIARTEEINPQKKYFIKSRVALKIKNQSSYYDLVNNLLSIFQYRTTYYTSQTYTGAALLTPGLPSVLDANSLINSTVN